MNTGVFRQLKTLEDDKIKHIEKFVRVLTKVVNAVYSKNRKDFHFIEFKDQYDIFKSTNSELLVMYVGPYFWKYREDIMSDKFQQLIENNYESDVMEHKLTDDNMINKINILITKFKKTWSVFSDAERIDAKTKCKQLIGIYAAYLSDFQQIEVIHKQLDRK